MGKPKSPPPVDYQGLAKVQGQEDRSTAAFNAALNRPTQTGATGDVSWSLKPGGDPNNPYDFVQSTRLSYDQQRLLDAQENAGLQAFNTTMGAGQGAQRSLQSGPQYGGLTRLREGTPVTSAGSNVGDYARDKVQQALMQRMEPGLAQGEEAKKVELLNAGIERGTEGWNREMQQLGDIRNRANIEAILAGGQEQSRMVGDDLAAGSFANQASQQDFMQSLASRGQGFQEATSEYQLPIQSYLQLLSGAGGYGPTGPTAPGGFSPAGGAPNSSALDAAGMQDQANQSAYGTQMGGYNSTMGTIGSIAAMAAMIF